MLPGSMSRPAIDIIARAPQPQSSCPEWKHLDMKHRMTVCMDRPPMEDARGSATLVDVMRRRRDERSRVCRGKLLGMPTT